MPDPIHVLGVLALTAVVAALAVLAGGWPWRSPHPGRAGVAGVVGPGAAFFLGAGLIESWPRWPPAEDQDRFLLILLPAVLLVEGIAAVPRVPRRLAWALRLLLAVGAGPVLLYGSPLMGALAGRGTGPWSPSQAATALAVLAAGLILVWAALGSLVASRPQRSTLVALALTCGGAAATVLLSGYATGGLRGLALAAALAGAAVAFRVLSPPRGLTGAVGVGVVGLFALVVTGRFFGSLTTFHAVLLLLAPLLCWLPALAPLGRLRPAARGALSALLVALPLALAVVQAERVREQAEEGQGETEASEPSSPPAPPVAPEPTPQDYENFGR
jgi:hypothetical protein